MLYRRLYRIAGILMAIRIVAAIAALRIVMGSRVAPSSVSLLMLVISGSIVGLFANRWYYNHAVWHVSALKVAGLASDEALARRGGTRTGIAAGVFALFVLLQGVVHVARDNGARSLVIRADGKSIVLSGDLYGGAAADLAKALGNAPTVTTVVLQSRGGLVITGNQLARVIAASHLNTSVEGECSSACTIAFLAGTERSAQRRSKIGFHSFRNVTAPDRTDRDLTQYIYGHAGLSTSFIARVVGTPSDSMWYPSYDELLAEGVLTGSSLQAAHGGSEGAER